MIFSNDAWKGAIVVASIVGAGAIGCAVGYTCAYKRGYAFGALDASIKFLEITNSAVKEMKQNEKLD